MVAVKRTKSDNEEDLTKDKGMKRRDNTELRLELDLQQKHLAV